MFKLDQEKEIMPYGIYNLENINKKWIDIEYTKINYLEKNQWNQFDYNLKKWNLINNKNEFNIIKYSIMYCHLDCEILEKGYNIFKNWINESLKLDIDDILTSASLADKYLTI